MTSQLHAKRSSFVSTEEENLWIPSRLIGLMDEDSKKLP